VKYNFSPSFDAMAFKSIKKTNSNNVRKKFDDYKIIIDSGFFKIPGPSDLAGESQNSTGSLSELTLLGTITGPFVIARAMISKTGEKNPGIFALYKYNSEITNNVYGNKLIGIADTKVFLEVNGQKVTLDLYAKKTVGPQTNVPGSPNQRGIGETPKLTQNLSRSEIKQKVFNNLDDALRGLQAGPYRVNGQIVGYRLINVQPFNILYRLGARSGDIIKRLNGQVLDSTQKLYSMWETIKNDPRITVDLERDGKNVRYDFNITE
jgi:general secretion pathway protein C